MPNFDGTPSGLTIEQEIGGVWTDIGADKVERSSYKRPMPISGENRQLHYRVVQKGGGLDLRNWQKVRVKDPSANRYFGGLTQIRKSSRKGRNEKQTEITVAGYSILMSRGSKIIGAVE